jgi:hypothetical protein
MDPRYYSTRVLARPGSARDHFLPKPCLFKLEQHNTRILIDYPTEAQLIHTHDSIGILRAECGEGGGGDLGKLSREKPLFTYRLGSYP